MKTWKCGVCGYVCQGETPPEQCPLCSASADKFKEIESGTEKFVCGVCKNVYEGYHVPIKCPQCGADWENFSELKTEG